MLDKTRTECLQRDQTAAASERERDVTQVHAVVEHVAAGDEDKVPLAPVQARARERFRSSVADHQQRDDAPVQSLRNGARACRCDAGVDVERNGRYRLPCHAGRISKRRAKSVPLAAPGRAQVRSFRLWRRLYPEIDDPLPPSVDLAPDRNVVAGALPAASVAG